MIWSTDALLATNSFLTTAAFAGLLWRLIGRWPLSSSLSRSVVTLFAALELIVAMLTARRVSLGGPFNEVQWLLLAHALCVIAVVFAWPRLLDPTGVRR